MFHACFCLNFAVQKPFIKPIREEQQVNLMVIDKQKKSKNDEEKDEE